MTQYSDGRRFEYKVRDALVDDGYEVIRAAGSKGKIDLVAFKQWNVSETHARWHMLFIQVKRRDGNIGPTDRAELLRLARIVWAVPIVAYQPQPRKPIQYRELTGPGPREWREWTPNWAVAP